MALSRSLWLYLALVTSSGAAKTCSVDGGECFDEEKYVEQQQVSLLQAQMQVHKADESKEASLLRAAGLPVALGPPKVDYADMVQGSLGDCWFLAALVSIAKFQPAILEGMFVQQQLSTGDTPVYTMQFRINGKETLVAVNDKLPSKSGNLFFAKPRKPDGNYWPSIIEKGWAKMFGSYKIIESGRQREAFKAITQAPVVFIHLTKTSKSEVWNQLILGMNKKYLMGTITSGSCPAQQPGGIGIYCGHAYAILGAYVLSGFPQAVKIYNPHGADLYAGQIENSNKDDGIFYVTLDEFRDNFNGLDIAEVIDGAKVSAITLSTQFAAQVVLEFEMYSDGPFAVQLEWPSSRLVKACKGGTLDPKFKVLVAKKDSLTEYHAMPKSKSFMSNARLSMSGGAGTYVVFVSVDFPKGQWLREYVVNVYGPETELKKPTQDPMALFLSMQGLCKTITMPGGLAAYQGRAYTTYTLDPSTKVNGLPIFRGATEGSGQVLSGYAVMYSTESGWDIIGSVDKAKAGIYIPSFRSAWKQATCAASLLDEAQPPAGHELVPAVNDRPVEMMPPTVPTKDGEPIDEATLLEADAERGACSEEMARLGNLASWVTGSDDYIFPASMDSIASPGVDCGDTATGKTDPCSKFNHWQSIAEVKKDMAAKAPQAGSAASNPCASCTNRNYNGVCKLDATYGCLTPDYNYCYDASNQYGVFSCAAA